MHKKTVRIEVDPAKNKANRRKHGVPLQAASGFDWETVLEREDDRFDYGETRFVAIGLIDGGLVDDDAVRVISLRPAEKHEARYYHGQVRLGNRR